MRHCYIYYLTHNDAYQAFASMPRQENAFEWKFIELRLSTGQRIACAAPECACMPGSSLAAFVADCSQQDAATSRHSDPGWGPTLPMYDM